MATQKLPEIKGKKKGTGKNATLIIVIGEEAPIEYSGEKVDEAVNLVKEYRLKKSSKNLQALREIVQETKVKEEKVKEELKTKTLATKKLVKKKLEITKQELKTKKKVINSIAELVTVKSGDVALKGYEEIIMPTQLVEKIKEVAANNQDYQPFIKFWKLCLLNPNVVARGKFFDYLLGHNLMVTPNGYVVTYRMVKSTDRKTADGRPIYTSNHTKKEDYIIGESYRLDRKNCDDNGKQDCSQGLHTGSPAFIGIMLDNKLNTDEGTGHLGDGYGIKYVTTKAAHPQSYGTGYDRPTQVSTPQKFDNSFGNVAVICLVNPMNVVAIPESDTRKMRSCELFFAKVTSPEEVLNHLTTNDYFVFDNQYKTIEDNEIEALLKETNIKPHALSSKAKASAKTKLEDNKKLLESNLKELNQFALNKYKITLPAEGSLLSTNQVKDLLASRLVNVENNILKPVSQTKAIAKKAVKKVAAKKKK
jgi:hypothetical protein